MKHYRHFLLTCNEQTFFILLFSFLTCFQYFSQATHNPQIISSFLVVCTLSIRPYIFVLSFFIHANSFSSCRSHCSINTLFRFLFLYSHMMHTTAGNFRNVNKFCNKSSVDRTCIFPLAKCLYLMSNKN